MATLKKQIINLLTEKGIYEESDKSLIDELIFNLKVCQMAKKDILKNGLEKNVAGKDKAPVYQKNVQINTYNEALKLYIKCANSLGITPSDRVRLRLSEKITEPDDFGKDFEI